MKSSFINFLNTQMVILNQSIDYTMISKQSDLYQIFKRSVQFAMQIPRENFDSILCHQWRMTHEQGCWNVLGMPSVKCWSLVTMVVLLQKYTENNLTVLLLINAWFGTSSLGFYFNIMGYILSKSYSLVLSFSNQLEYSTFT